MSRRIEGAPADGGMRCLFEAQLGFAGSCRRAGRRFERLASATVAVLRSRTDLLRARSAIGALSR
jgi:hypothetical protein